MQISVIICTRNRGTLIEATLRNIFDGSRTPNELIVIDQSDADTTCTAVNQFAENNPVVRYIRTDTRGLCLARNIGLAEASGEIIAFTDDDVLVCDDWLERVEKEFVQYPELALFFGTVIPPDTYDYATEFIPYTILPTCRPIKWHDKRALNGMGANMALRKKTVEIIGDFDTATGAGTSLYGNDDREYALRALCGLPGSPGLCVHLSDEARVIHHAGARSGDEYHRFVHQMNGTGEGKYWAYMLRRKFRYQYAFKLFQQNMYAIGGFAGQILRGRRPSGALTYLYYLRAFWSATLAPLSKIPIAPSGVLRCSPNGIDTMIVRSVSTEGIA